MNFSIFSQNADGIVTDEFRMDGDISELANAYINYLTVKDLAKTHISGEDLQRFGEMHVSMPPFGIFAMAQLRGIRFKDRGETFPEHTDVVARAIVHELQVARKDPSYAADRWAKADQYLRDMDNDYRGQRELRSGSRGAREPSAEAVDFELELVETMTFFGETLSELIAAVENRRETNTSRKLNRIMTQLDDRARTLHRRRLDRRGL